MSHGQQTDLGPEFADEPPRPGELEPADYEVPTGEAVPVLRIPVVGPDPYNTLVIVRGLNMTPHRWVPADGKVRRLRFAFPTPFRLIGHDPRIAPKYEHSTAA